jgi:Zn-dependent protease
MEANGSLQDAREQWQSALQLLPPDSPQAQWINGHIRELQVLVQSPGASGDKGKWTKRLAPLGPLALILAKGKTFLFAIFKLKFLLSFGAFIALYWAAYGPKFGIGFAVLILVHEMGHFIDIKRRGLPADMPVFLPGFGAYVRWQALGVPVETRAEVSLAGPLAGWFGAAICGLIWFQTGDGVWAALARSSAWLNILNLIPVWLLDGGQAVQALKRMERAMLLVAAVGLAIVLDEKVFYLVAAGAAWQLIKAVFLSRATAQPAGMTVNFPSFANQVTTEKSGYAVISYYLAVLAALGLVMRLMPGHGFGR